MNDQELALLAFLPAVAGFFIGYVIGYSRGASVAATIAGDLFKMLLNDKNDEGKEEK